MIKKERKTYMCVYVWAFFIKNETKSPIEHTFNTNIQVGILYHNNKLRYQIKGWISSSDHSKKAYLKCWLETEEEHR